MTQNPKTIGFFIQIIQNPFLVTYVILTQPFPPPRNDNIGGYPPFGKRPNHFRFFKKASLTHELKSFLLCSVKGHLSELRKSSNLHPDLDMVANQQFMGEDPSENGVGGIGEGWSFFPAKLFSENGAYIFQKPILLPFFTYIKDTSR